MEVKIKNETKNRLEFDIDGATHTFANILKEELWNDEKTKNVGYSQEHPLINTQKFILETDGSEPKKVIISAIERIKKSMSKIKDQASKI